MKKPTLRSKKWLAIHSRNAARRRYGVRGTPRPSGAPAAPVAPGAPKTRRHLNEVRVPAPAILCLTKNCDEVLKLFAKMPAISSSGKKLYIDFATITQVSTDAALLLAAQFDLWQRIRKIKLGVRSMDKWAPQVNHVFRNLGLFDLLKTTIPEGSNKPFDPELEILKFSSGENSDGSLANHLAQALNTISGGFETTTLFSGLTEAMTNVVQHAYPKDDFSHLPADIKSWWMTGSFNRKDRSLKITILDLGVGIPSTLPRSGFYERIKGFLTAITNPDDADRIDAAVQVGRTSTGIPGRGRGLNDMRKFIENNPRGRLRILSGHGEVIYRTGSELPEKVLNNVGLNGTLIEWEIFP
jgi:anti-anti-sigma regulatory factor